jgi:hypothetical protein
MLFMGSCFSGNIGDMFMERRFNAMVNPFGILYNPVSVSNSLDILTEKYLLNDKELFMYEGIWHSFYHHSRYSGPERDEVIKATNDDIIAGHEMLKKADFLFITLGTAWVYEFIETGKIVSNCHKLPANLFHRYRLNVDEVIDVLSGTIKKIKKLNPELRIVFTVSPVRHWKDGAHGNQLSKSVLLLAIDELESRFTNVSYFPSYELVMDELRDYRFYDEDMLHPSDTAVKFIWEKLNEVYFTDDTKRYVKEVEKIMKARNHRPFNPSGDNYKTLARNMLKKVGDLKKRFPGVELNEYESFFENINSF